ncbi:hypothetical protein IP88_11935 [alpha proteobacterium AAP81b]|nr:hypothetical protein IP88_11935 [alpha proteobacterium AAP81b]
MPTLDPIVDLLSQVRRCRICAPHLEPRPVVQLSATARVLIIGQAPGARVHASGVPWDDASGERLRDWTGIGASDFYDPAKVSLVPMGFCYPGTGDSGDLPPRPECAPLWHGRLLALLPPDRLTVLVGQYAQARYLPGKAPLTARVRAGGSAGVFPLPHPSWRVQGWMAKHPWFAAETLPALRSAVAARLFAADG